MSGRIAPAAPVRESRVVRVDVADARREVGRQHEEHPKQQRKPAYTVFAMYEHQYCERVMLPRVNSSAARVVSSDE